MMTVVMISVTLLWVAICGVLSFLSTGELPKKKQDHLQGESIPPGPLKSPQGHFLFPLPLRGVAATLHRPPRRQLALAYHLPPHLLRQEREEDTYQWHFYQDKSTTAAE